MEIDYSGDPVPAGQIDYSRVNVQPVPNTSCPANQSAGADALAWAMGFTGVNEVGADHGLGLCEGKTLQNEQIYYVPEVYCSAGNSAESTSNGLTFPGTVMAQCIGNVAASPYQAGSSSIAQFTATTAECTSQQDGAQYEAFLADYYGGTPPYRPNQYGELLSKAGQSCTYTAYKNIYGTTCGNAVSGIKSGSSSSSCFEIDYTDDGVGSPVIKSVNPVDASQCQADQSIDDLDRRILAEQGLVPGGAGSAATCSNPNLYAARGACVQTVSYDAGWPRNGSVRISDAYKAQCFAVFNAGNASQMTLQQVPVADCATQTLTDQQRQELQPLAPDLVDYASLPHKDGDACQLDAQTRLYYSRSDQASGETDGPVGPDEQYQGESALTNTVSFSVDVPYICSELEDYNTNDQANWMGSSFSMGDEPCRSAHTADVNGIQSTPLQSYLTPSPVGAEMPPHTKFPAGNTLGALLGTGLQNSDAFNAHCGRWDNDPTDWSERFNIQSIAVSDHPDQSGMTITVSGSCYTPL
jgi:hypothetical protein